MIQVVQEIKGHSDSVRGLLHPKFDLTHVWSISLDGMVVLWTYRFNFLSFLVKKKKSDSLFLPKKQH